MTETNIIPFNEILKMLTPDQMDGFQTAISGANCFITGGAGTGKSVLITVITRYFQEHNKNVLLCAPTGSAATKIGGATIHRTFGMPSTIAVTPKTSKIRVRAPKEVALADVLIIDEISMCRMDLFDSIFASLEKVCNKTGKQIQLIVVGDFCQLPPILENKHNERAVLEQYYGRPIRETYAFLSNSWAKCRFVPIILKTVKRQENAEFIDALNKARLRELDSITYFNTFYSKQAFTDGINLYPRKKSVEVENNNYLMRDGGTVYEFDTIFDSGLTSYDIVDIPKSLRLKEGVKVIITANDTNTGISEDPLAFMQRCPSDKAPDYHNGTTGTILKIEQYANNPEKDCIIVKLENTKILMFYRMKYPVYYYDVTDDKFEKKVLGYYRQFPLHLAHAITVHRSQGQTYDAVNIDTDCTDSGQLYVALSRAKDISGVHLLHKIQPWNLRLDKCVKEFYENLGKPIAESIMEVETDAIEQVQPTLEHSEEAEPIKSQEVHVVVEKKKPVKGKAPTPKGGRPARFPTGSTTIRVPNEIAEPLRIAIEIMYPKLGTGKMDIESINRISTLLEEIANKEHCE